MTIRVHIFCAAFSGILLAASASAYPIYKYVDEDGTVAYTDQEQLIPEKYRPQVTVLNQESVTPIAPDTQDAPVAQVSAPRNVQKPARFSLETVGAPLMRGLAGIVMVVAGLLLVRRIAGPTVLSAGFVNSILMVIVLACLYDVYLADRFSSVDAERGGWHIRRAVARMKSEVRQVIEQPLKPVRKTVQKANAAVEKEQEVLRQITSDPPPDSLQ